MLVLCASFLSTVHAQSPKALFEMIGNPQVDLNSQHQAYYRLDDSASGSPDMWWAGDTRTNHIESAYYLAECYLSGKTGKGGPDPGLPENEQSRKGFPLNRPEAYKLAVPLYEKAAYYNYLPSLVKLSAIYADDRYAGKNLDKSLTYLIKAAKLGDKNSIEKLSSLFSATFPGVTDESQKYAGTEVLAKP